jgi:predicted acetylornithine/succinylornithine family transaminase
MTTQEVLDLYGQCIMGSYARQPVVIARAEGSQMWDLEGRRYLDLFPGWGCSLLGHCHPRVVEAIREQAARLIHLDNTFCTVEQARLAQILSERSFGGKCFFSNSGAEANEGAIKLARRHAGEGRYKIITMERSFHGRTFGAMSATAQSKTQQGYDPLLPGFVYVPFNNIDAVAKAITDETAAVMLEPIQGEGGVNVPDDDYLPLLRELCDEHNLLLIVDEVQTGCGRTGTWFGYQNWGIEPDIMTLAKALAGGAPMGAIVAKPEVAAAFTPGSHGSTFGGNPLVVAAAIAAFEAIEQENLLERTKVMGEYIVARAKRLQNQFGFVEQVRGKGLMLAIELSLPGAPIVAAAMERGLRVNCTQSTILRLLPAMTITEAEVDEAFDILAAAMQETESKLVTQ